LRSDAYATGVALYALQSIGVNRDDPVYRNGVRFLVQTQAADGSWYVASRAPKIQPYFQSGFPYDHDQWISAAATAWSVTALAQAAASSPDLIAAGRAPAGDVPDPAGEDRGPYGARSQGFRGRTIVANSRR
jgi:hypothetical protein